MANLTVSVIIPAFNSHATIRRALESVLAQTIPPDEILIIDDGSEPGLESCFGSLPPTVRMIRQPNRGAAAARNRGLDAATGQVIAFLDADDYWLPQKLERHLEALESSPDLGLTFSRYYEQTPHGQTVLQAKRIRKFPEFGQCRQYAGRDAFDVACCVWTSTVVARRSAFEEERFRPGLEPAEDRELWLRLLAVAPVMCLNEALAVAVLVPDSLSRSQIERDCRNMMRVIELARATLGWRGTWWWKRRTFRRWASEYLGRQSSSAWRPAFWRWCYEPWSPEAAWILIKSVSLFRPFRCTEQVRRAVGGHPALCTRPPE